MLNSLLMNQQKERKISGRRISRFLRRRVQHIAVATKDIIKNSNRIESERVEFLSAPPEAYYEMVPERVGTIDEDIKNFKT